MNILASPRKFARDTKRHLIRFKKAHRPIVVMALRRGGSTMVADAIAINRGVWRANEPYAVFPAHPGYALKQRVLPPREHSQFFDLNPAEDAKFATFSRDMLYARHAGLGSCARPKFLLRADRVCLKVLNAPWMIDWFTENTDAHVLPLVRHPGAQAVSVMRQNWDFAVEAYGRQLDRIGHHFSKHQQIMIRETLQSGDLWAMSVLDYAVLTRMFFSRYSETLVRYEDIVRDPARFVDDVLIAKFGLTERDRMLQTLAKPSHSSRMSLNTLNQAIEAGDVDVVLNMWRAKVTPEMQTTGQHILDTFDIDAYHFLDKQESTS